MAAPKGNKYAIGNRGGGRLNVKEQEKHKEAWFSDDDVVALEAKVLSKKYSPWDMYRLRALKGDQKVLVNWANKVLADLHDVDLRGKIDTTVTNISPETQEAIKAAMQYAIPNYNSDTEQDAQSQPPDAVDEPADPRPAVPESPSVQ